MSIELYHGDGTRSFRVRWLLEELGMAYALHRTPFPPRVRQPDYLTINPLGSLPFLIDGDVRMSESMAICEYLLARHGPTPLTVTPDAPGFADYLQFCWFGEATLMTPVGTIVRFCNGLYRVNPLSFISSPEACFCPQSIGSLLDGVG